MIVVVYVMVIGALIMMVTVENHHGMMVMIHNQMMVVALIGIGRGTGAKAGHCSHCAKRNQNLRCNIHEVFPMSSAQETD